MLSSPCGQQQGSVLSHSVRVGQEVASSNGRIRNLSSLF